jgi:2,3-bisphosphoglycerate-independent phosphoglycerate mutase
MVVTDHFTPIALKTHTPEPVPYAVLYGKAEEGQPSTLGFNEKSALTAGLLHEDCEAFIVEFIGKPLPVS